MTQLGVLNLNFKPDCMVRAVIPASQETKGGSHKHVQGLSGFEYTSDNLDSNTEMLKQKELGAHSTEVIDLTLVYLSPIKPKTRSQFSPLKLFQMQFYNRACHILSMCSNHRMSIRFLPFRHLSVIYFKQCISHFFTPLQ